AAVAVEPDAGLGVDLSRLAEGAQGLPPEPDAVQALRPGARDALQRLVRRREPGRRRVAARRALVDLERAQPGRLAAAPADEARRGGADDLPTAGERGGSPTPR